MLYGAAVFCILYSCIATKSDYVADYMADEFFTKSEDYVAIPMPTMRPDNVVQDSKQSIFTSKLKISNITLSLCMNMIHFNSLFCVRVRSIELRSPKANVITSPPPA